MALFPAAPVSPGLALGRGAGVLLLLWLLSLGLATPAGTVIRNQAVAMVDGQSILSNQVETVVQAVCLPSLTPNGLPGRPAQQAWTPPGGSVYFSYLLRNSGNDGFVFDLGWVQYGGPWTPSSVRFYLDVNANARLDPGEAEVRQLTLAAAQAVRLILAVETPLAASGQLPVSPTATCPDGTRDADNFSLVGISVGAALNIVKSVDTPQARQGQEVSFSIRVSNLGGARAAGPVYVTDMLDVPELSGLSFVAGSASAAKGRLEFYDGAAWSTSQTQVRGVRLVLDGLEVGEGAEFSFRMQVAAGASPGPRRNLATVDWATGNAQALVELQVAGRFAHALGPVDNPQAAGAADRQSAWVLSGQPNCFAQTLLNTGSLADTYTLEAEGLPGGVSLSYRLPVAGSLATPIPLEPGASRNFLACLPGLPAGTTPFTFTLLARSGATGATDPTANQVSQVFDSALLVLRKSSDVGPTVTPGELVRYSLHIQNALPMALEDLLIEDLLDASLEFISASDGGSYSPHSRLVRWRQTLPANSSLTLSLKARVRPTAPDAATIANRFSLRSGQILNPLVSNEVILRVQAAAALLLEKQAQPAQVTFGDLVTYTITVANVGQVALVVNFEDSPDPGLAYLPGSASPSEPALHQGRLIWSSLALAPGARTTLTYQMRVLPGASERLYNTVLARGTLMALGQTAASSPVVAQAAASAVVQLQRGVFASPNSLLGRVFLDTDRDGLYTAGLDLPLPGARIVLSNGLQVLTDAEGRYTFRNLAGGVWGVMLDPASAPFRPLPRPGQQGDGFHQRVRVEGLTISDFPLERPSGLARAMRETTLEFGPLRIDKRLLPLPDGVRVVLVLQSSETLNELTITDPLPGGGEQVFHFAQFQGKKTLTYDLPGGYLTDPQARWRYP